MAKTMRYTAISAEIKVISHQSAQDVTKRKRDTGNDDNGDDAKTSIQKKRKSKSKDKSKNKNRLHFHRRTTMTKKSMN